MFPLLGPLLKPLIASVAKKLVKQAAQAVVSKEVEKRAMQEAAEQANKLIAELRSDIYFTILWQNTLLIGALFVSYQLRSVVPFYLCYAIVLAYSLLTVGRNFHYAASLIRTRSLFQVVRLEVLKAIKLGMERLGLIERFVIDHLGPDLDILSDKVARKIYPAIKSALLNLVLTIVIAFVVFRLWLLPELSKGVG